MKNKTSTNRIKQNNNWIERFEKRFGKRLGSMEMLYQNHGGEPFIGQTIPVFIQSVRDEAVEEAHLKWNKEMREKIGGDEDIELDLDDPNGKEIQTLNIYRNQFRHQLLKQKVKDLDND